MKSILKTVFCMALTWQGCGRAWAQQPPVMTDEVIRMLGGDPDKSRAEAAKNSLKLATPEEVATDIRVHRMEDTLTDDTIRRISSADPVLLGLYMSRTAAGQESYSKYPWLEVVDRDIRRRPEAKALLRAQVLTPTRPTRRLSILNWLAANPDVPWGNEIMEDAMLLHRAEPDKWQHSEIWGLCRLIQVRGDESHLAFLDEVHTKSGSDHGAATRLRRRLDEEKKKGLLPPRSTPDSVNQKIGDGRETAKVPGQGNETSALETSASVRWAVLTGAITVGLGFLALLLKRRAK